MYLTTLVRERTFICESFVFVLLCCEIEQSGSSWETVRQAWDMNCLSVQLEHDRRQVSGEAKERKTTHFNDQFVAMILSIFFETEWHEFDKVFLVEHTPLIEEGK